MWSWTWAAQSKHAESEIKAKDGFLYETEKLMKRIPVLNIKTLKLSIQVVSNALIFSFISSYLIKDLPRGQIIYSPIEQSMMQQPCRWVQHLDKKRRRGPVKTVRKQSQGHATNPPCFIASQHSALRLQGATAIPQ